MTAYPAARAAAARVYPHYAQHLATAGDEEKRKLERLPNVETIEAIIDVAFWASLRREELEAMHRLKTGALIRASVSMAAACSAPLTEAQRTALDVYSQDIGLAFQIQDDILDVEGNTEVLGKTTGADAARCKPTYPSIMGLAAAKARAQELKQRACGQLRTLGSRAEVLAWLARYVVDRRV